jgi:hypothetical protein
MIAPARLLVSVLRRWSGAVHLLAALLVILWLALTTSGAAARSPLIERYQVYDPSTTPEGALFALDEEILTDRVATAATEAFGGPDGYERARQRSRGMSSDALTRDYMAAFDGYLTGLIAIRFFKGLAVAPDAVNRVLESYKNVMHLPDGSTLAVPLQRALPLNAGTMRIAAENLRAREPPVQLAQAYVASVEGTCPFPAGRIELSQRGFLVEGVRDGRLLLAGAVGRTRATFLALEARYATITRAEERTEGAGGPLDIALPDRPSELYEAALDTPRVTLNGLTFKSCTIVLTPLLRR